ncbi:MAG: LysM peptidoglycan-binding domain-containing protein [Gemmatimonadaceae bacterium]|nr:LysM peptidoglycan-binding domain-containing protein [Gemmatimonadaceae bacterium]
MGIFDKDPLPDFSDVGGSAKAPSANRADADFSDVQGSSSTTASSGEQSYTVKSGDSLSKIAKHFYGDGNKWHQIHAANRDKIPNPDLIHPGDVLIIPGA